MKQKKTTDSLKKNFITAPVLLSSSEAKVIQAVKRGCTSRMAITAATGWSKTKTCQEVKGLLGREILLETQDEASGSGSRQRLLKINDCFGYVVGIDIGATSIEIALANIHGIILARVSEAADVRNPPEEVLGRCSALILKLASQQNIHPREVLGIGVGVPGPVDFIDGVLVVPPLMPPSWESYSIRGFFKDTFPSAVVVVDNDVNIMALGEQSSSEVAGIDHFLVIKIGTGIGCGIMVNQEIYRGSNGCAGDIGHICVDKKGPICQCGNQGCLEAMAAGPAIADKAMQAVREGKSQLLRRMMEANGGVLTAKQVNSACQEGDIVSLEIIRESGWMVGEVLAGLVNFFNPSHIFIGGGIAHFGNHLLIAIKRAVLRRSLPLATTDLEIEFLHTGSDAGMIGAVMIALKYVFKVENGSKNFL